jgi:nucleoside-diphosphate-sugar epimerase
VVFDNGLAAHTRINSSNVAYVTGDVRESGGLDRVLRGADGVVHLAAIVGDRACEIDPDLSWETNYLGTVNLTRACKAADVGRLVFASTCSNYGVSLGQTADVFSPLRPQSIYAETKVRAEHHLLSARDASFSPCILRLATVYGVSPRMRFDLVVNLMTATAVFEQRVVIHGGEQCRPFLHVRDAAGVIVSALTATSNAHSELYNCGSDDENYRLLDVGNMVASEVSNTRVTVHPEMHDARNYRVSFAQMSDGLGYTCGRRLRDGIRDLRDDLIKGRYNDFTSEEYDNYLLTERYVRNSHTVPAASVNTDD